MANEPSQCLNLAAKAGRSALQQTVADVLRRLPEFQTRSEDRIQMVSMAVAKALAQIAERLEKS